MAKIRGQRFEPDEVETRYRQILPQKWQAVVEVITLQEDEMPKLAAFVALEHAYSNGRVDSVLLMETGRALQDFASALPRIKAELSTSLPSYMQPSTYIPLHTLSFTSSGKVDRRRLIRLAVTLIRWNCLGWYLQIPANVRREAHMGLRYASSGAQS